MSGKKISEEDKKEMVRLYVDCGHPSTKISKMFSCSYPSCLNAVKKAGLKPRDRSHAAQRYKVNEKFFNKIDTEEKAYIVGFIVADGCLINGALNIVLKGSDYSHLHKILKAMSSTHPVKISKVKDKRKNFKNSCERCSVGIGNKIIYAALKTLGLTENKTFTIKPTEGISNEFLKDYWRGVIDGDGSIITCTENRWNSGRKYYRINYTGNVFMVYGFRQFIRDKFNYEGYLVEYKSTNGKDFYYSINFSGIEKVRNICRFLYEDSNIYLDRKYELAMKAINFKREREDRSDITKDKMLELKEECGKWKYVAKKLNTSISEIRRIRQRVGLSLNKIKRFSSVEKKEIVKCYSNSNMKVSNIAIKFNSSVGGIYDILRRLDVSIDRQLEINTSEDNKKQIIQAYMFGKLKINEIVEKFNISEGTMYSILKQNEIKLRRNDSCTKKC